MAAARKNRRARSAWPPARPAGGDLPAGAAERQYIRAVSALASGCLSNGIMSQRSRSSPWQQDRHQGRRTVPPARLTQNPAGFCAQWMHSWMVCGSRAGMALVRSLSRGARGRTPAPGPDVAIARAGAGSDGGMMRRDAGRAVPAPAGTAARRASRKPARLARLWRMRRAYDPSLGALLSEREPVIMCCPVPGETVVTGCRTEGRPAASDTRSSEKPAAVNAAGDGTCSRPVGIRYQGISADQVGKDMPGAAGLVAATVHGGKD